jgi:hypothetical protein
MDAHQKLQSRWWESYIALGWAVTWVSTIFIHHIAGAYIFYSMLAISPFALLCGLSCVRRGTPGQQICGVAAWLIALSFFYLFLARPRF